MRLLHLYISPGHNYFGHHGQPPGDFPMIEIEKVHCVAGSGIRGDRFFNNKENHKRQITFFSNEVYESLCHEFDVWDKPPSVFRRNLISSGLDLNSFIGREFEVQGLRFFGVEECRPCYWMDEAFCPGAEQALKGRGGLRARVLTSGIVQVFLPPRTEADLYKRYTSLNLATA